MLSCAVRRYATPNEWMLIVGEETRLELPGASIWAHGVVVSHPLSMREALGSIPSVSTFVSPLLLLTALQESYAF